MSFIQNGPDRYSTNSFQVLPPAIIDVFDSLGGNNDSFLTEQECDYFRIMFSLEEDQNILKEKRVVFLTGSLGLSISNKIDFFNAEKKRYYAGATPLPKVLYIFDNRTAKHIGVDAAIVYYSKAIPNKSRVIKAINVKSKRFD